MNAKATTTLPQRTMWFTMVYLGGEQRRERRKKGRRDKGEKRGRSRIKKECRDGGGIKESRKERKKIKSVYTKVRSQSGRI